MRGVISDVDAARRALGAPTAIVFSPKAEKAMAGAGVPLAQVLSEAVTRNPSIRTYLNHVTGHVFKDGSTMVEYVTYDVDATAMLDGDFLTHQPAWPASLDGYDLFAEWCDRSGGRFAQIDPTERFDRGVLDALDYYNPTAEDLLEDIRGIALTIRERYEALMAPLRSGELEAFGHLQGGERSRISPAVWSDRKTRIRFGENEVLRLTKVEIEHNERWAPVRREHLQTLWSYVVVQRPAETVKPMPVAPIEMELEKAVDPRPRGAAGRPLKHPYAAGFDRLMVQLINDKAYPETGEQLVEMLLKALEASGSVKINDPKDLRKTLVNDFPLLYGMALKDQMRPPKRKSRGGETR